MEENKVKGFVKKHKKAFIVSGIVLTGAIGGIIFKKNMSGMKADMNGMKADMNGMKADIGELKADVSNLKTEAIKTNLRIENEIIPKLKVLAEGHAMLSETLAPKSKVDELQSDVELLKIVVKNLNSEVQQLKKAQ